MTNSYVLNKLFLVLFPWRHKPWSRKQGVGANGQDGFYLPPREDINSPDMYIPVMSLVTYILLSTLIAGLRGEFQPELLGYTASMALVVVVVEILGLKLGCYLLSISNQSQLLDLVAYSGYKFVGVIVTISVAEIVNGGKGTGGWVGWTVFFYTFLANSLFLVRAASAGGPRPPAQMLLTCRRRCGLSSTFCFPRTQATPEGPCRPTPGRSATRGRSSSSSTPTWCSSSSCGFCAGFRKGERARPAGK